MSSKTKQEIFNNQIDKEIDRLKAMKRRSGGYRDLSTESELRKIEQAIKQLETYIIHPIAPNMGGSNFIKRFLKKIIFLPVGWLFVPLYERVNMLTQLFYTYSKQNMSLMAKSANSMDDMDFDYFEFENKFRGSRQLIKNRLSGYIDFFAKSKNVLDIGSGRGEFVEMLTSKGIPVLGVDVNEEMVEYCRTLGLNVIHKNAAELLEKDKQIYDGVMMCQVAEHLSNRELYNMLGLCFTRMKPGSYMLIETPNPKSLYIYGNSFYIDPSHTKPVHPEYLRYIAERVGFTFEKVIPRSYVDGNLEKSGDDEVYNKNIDKLNQLVYGAQDYCIVLKR